MKAKGVQVLAAAAAALVLTACQGGGSSQVARGRYLVENVGLCSDCHSPRDAQGALVAGRELSGAPLLVSATVPIPFATAAPRIRGLPTGWTEGQLATFLQTGVRPNGTRPLPPMPPYRMNKADAEAAAAFIASLK